MLKRTVAIAILMTTIQSLSLWAAEEPPSAIGKQVAVEKEKQAAQSDEPSATIQDSVVRLNPSGAIFEIPQSWLTWQAGFKNNLHLSRAELEKVKTAEGDWDQEYAEIVNEFLPFSHCAAHVGGDGWGRDGVSYADLQLRVYIVDERADKLQAKLVEHGKDWAAKFSKEVSVARSDHGKWRRATLTYALWYGDYGGNAAIDTYAQDFGKQTAVFVFMHAEFRPSPASTIPDILKSFAWKR